MAFLESRLDTKITHGCSFYIDQPNRTMLRRSGGKLKQIFGASLPIHRCDLSHGVRSRADFQTILDLFYVVMFTPYEGFRVKDWRDFIATATNSALELVSGSDYQLQRKHTFGGVTFLRDITKPVASTVKVYNASNVELASTVDYETGIATVTGTPAYWTGEFDIPMTFSDNTWTGTLEVHTNNLHVSSSPIRLEEVR
jgi:uncharacterized protein (TIGR02217 family)